MEPDSDHPLARIAIPIELSRLAGIPIKTAQSFQLDPVVHELIRLYNAKVNDCQYCQNARQAVAVQSGMHEDMVAALSSFETSDLPDPIKAALRITAAIHPALRARRGLREQARQILDGRRYAVLGTENDDGSVHLAPVMFLLHNERILIETAAATRKARNVAARRHASVLVQTPDAAWAFGSGPATIVRGAEANGLNERIRDKYLTDHGQRACGDLFAELDDITIVVTPTRWLGWDMTGLLENLAARGADLDQVETWFRSDE